MSEVVFYHSGITGAPSTTLVAAGGLTALLDACLVDGFGSVSVTSMTRSGSTVTVTTSTTHTFLQNLKVQIQGASEAGYNGYWRVATVPTSNTFTFDIGLLTPTSPATGTITARLPPAGWSKSSGGTNITAYRGGPDGLQHWMQVEDNNPYADSNVGARTRLVDGWTALDTGAVLGEQIRTQKVNGTWCLVADDSVCYLFMNGNNAFCFGEVARYNGADAYPWFQTQGENNLPPFTGGHVPGRHFPSLVYQTGQSANYGGPQITWLREHSQINSWSTGGVMETARADIPNVAILRSAWVTAPNPADNAVPLLPMFLMEYAATAVLRGRLRGLYWPACYLPTGAWSNLHHVLDDVVIGGQTRTVVLLRVGLNGAYQLAFDISQGAAWI